MKFFKRLGLYTIDLKTKIGALLIVLLKVLMKNLAINEGLSFDTHFKQFGSNIATS